MSSKYDHLGFADTAGGFGATFKKQPPMTKPAMLFNSLKVLAANKALIGAQLDMELFPKMSKSTKAKFYANGRGQGIEPKYMYTVLDLREIVAPDATGKGVKHQLVRLRCPWSGAPSWKGACSSSDKEFWTEAVKSSFNTRNVVDEAAAEHSEVMPQRLVHEWASSEDGVFVMKIEDFAKVFNKLSVSRPFDSSWLQMRFERTFLPSHGPVSTKTQEWLENTQFAFTNLSQDNKPIRANFHLEQSDSRFKEGADCSAPFPRLEIGFIVIEMSKSQETINHYEPKRLVTLVKPQPLRCVSASVNLENKRYCVIPFTGRKGDQGSYTLTMEFQTEERNINFVNKKLLSSSITTMQPTMDGLDGLRKMSSLMRQIKTPFLLDKVVNDRDDTKPSKDKESVRENVRLVVTQDIKELDDPVHGTGFKLGPNSEMDIDRRDQVLLGVDQDEENDAAVLAERKKRTEEERADFREMKEMIGDMTSCVLDLSHYHLGNDGLLAIIPVLEYEYLLNVRVIDLSYNNLGDAGVCALAESLGQLGSPIEELDLSGNNLTDQSLNLLSDHIKTAKCKRLARIVTDACPRISKDALRVLKIAQMKAEGYKAATQNL